MKIKKIATTNCKKLLRPCIHIDCDCLGGKKYCGYLRVYDYGDNDIDLSVYSIPDKKWRGVYLTEKNVKKLIKFLQNAICLPTKSTKMAKS